MKDNELSAKEKLDVAIQSHRFYHRQCIQMENKINKKIDEMFHTEEAGENVSKEDIKNTVDLVSKLLTLSNKFIKEAGNVVNEIDNVKDGEEDFSSFKLQLTHISGKQEKIHERVEEIQEMLIEMYNLNEDDTC